MAIPPILASWNRWSIVVHFTLALVGVAAVRDSNPVVANKILELKAETAKQDLITLRKAAMLGNPLLLFAAKLRGLLDGAKLARELLGGRADLPPNYVSQIDEITNALPGQINSWSGLFLPVSSQKNSQERNLTDSNEVNKSIASPTPMDEQLGEQKGEQVSEQRNSDCIALGEQYAPSSQWLKSILPEASNGWWDIRDKGSSMAIKFRWRDPDLQVITPLRVTNEQLNALKRICSEDAKSRIREQISLGLNNLSMDPARRDKARFVARKLGINLESYQERETANSNERDK